MSFWANKLNNQPQQAVPILTSRELYPQYMPPAMVPEQLPQQVQPQTYTPTARTIKGSICPGCGSDKYLGRHGDRAIACGECGYHPRFEQSGYMEPNIRDDKARASRQSGDSQTMADGMALLRAGGGEHINHV